MTEFGLAGVWADRDPTSGTARQVFVAGEYYDEFNKTLTPVIYDYRPSRSIDCLLFSNWIAEQGCSTAIRLGAIRGARDPNDSLDLFAAGGGVEQFQSWTSGCAP